MRRRQLLGPEDRPARRPAAGESGAVVRRPTEHGRWIVVHRAAVGAGRLGAQEDGRAPQHGEGKKKGPGDRSPGPGGHGLHDPAPCTPTKLADGFGTKSLPDPDTLKVRNSPQCYWVLRFPFRNSAREIFCRGATY